MHFALLVPYLDFSTLATENDFDSSRHCALSAALFVMLFRFGLSFVIHLDPAILPIYGLAASFNKQRTGACVRKVDVLVEGIDAKRLM